jgi:hypothetical protein
MEQSSLRHIIKKQTNKQTNKVGPEKYHSRLPEVCGDEPSDKQSRTLFGHPEVTCP